MIGLRQGVRSQDVAEQPLLDDVHDPRRRQANCPISHWPHFSGSSLRKARIRKEKAIWSMAVSRSF
jgi:hypothetical protein